MTADRADRALPSAAAPDLKLDSATAVVSALGMREHPEGGWFVETWRAAPVNGDRPSSSAILYLLAAGERSHWHRVDADEIWQFSAGDPLELRVWGEGDPTVTTHRLHGIVTVPGSTPQVVVPANAWQAAASLGAWTLVGCIVAPAFEFSGFELAPAGWEPPVAVGRPAARGRGPSSAD